MLKQFPTVELIKAIQTRIKAGTGRKCLDAVRKNEKSPFIYAEFKQSRPANSKTMFMTDYTVYIHAISEPTDSSVPILKYIGEIEEAMTQDIEIPEPYSLVMQTYSGVMSNYTEETKEKHAVLSFTFRIAYGFKSKI